MNENKGIEIENLEKTDDKQNLENKKIAFENPKFYLGYFIILIPFIFFCMYGEEYSEVFMFFYSIPYLIITVILWLALRESQKDFAFGILLAGFTPVVLLSFMFILFMCAMPFLNYQ